MADALRLFFLAFYAIGVVVLVLRVLPLAFRSAPRQRSATPSARREAATGRRSVDADAERKSATPAGRAPFLSP